MKKLSLLIALFASTSVLAGELHNFEQIKEAVVTGKTLHILVDFAKCSTQDKLPAHISIGVFIPHELQMTDSYVVTSLLHFTMNNKTFPGKPIYEFVTFNITDDNQVKLTADVLNATNYAPLTKRLSFNCKIDTGAKIFESVFTNHR